MILGRSFPIPSSLKTRTFTVSSETVQYLQPKAQNGVLLIYVHGFGENHTAPLTDGLKSALITDCLNEGYIVASSDARGNAWGRQDSIDSYEDLVADSVTRFGSRPILLLAQSMGGLPAMNALRQGVIPRCIGCGLIYPVQSLLAMEAGEYGDDIASAYNVPAEGSYEDATEDFDPARAAIPEFPDIPYRFYASEDDSVCPKSLHSDVVNAKFGGHYSEHVVVECTGDHGDTSHFQSADLRAFFARCRGLA